MENLLNAIQNLIKEPLVQLYLMIFIGIPVTISIVKGITRN